MLYVGLTVLCF